MLRLRIECLVPGKEEPEGACAALTQALDLASEAFDVRLEFFGNGLHA